MNQSNINTSCTLNHASSRRWKLLFLVMILFLIASFLFTGCSSMQLADYPMALPSSFNNATTQNDLCIAVHAITEHKDRSKYFGAIGTLIGTKDWWKVHTHLPEIDRYGVTTFANIDKFPALKQYFGITSATDFHYLMVQPVYVVVENKSPSSSFLLSKDNISVQHKGRSIRGLSSEALRNFSDTLLESFARQDYEIIKENFAAKGLQTRTISPGQTVSGFVYFGFSEQDAPLKEWIISVDVKELGSDSTHQFVFTLE
jgi:hypothetical protein